MRKTIWPTVILLAVSILVYRNAIHSFGHDVDETFHVKSALVRPQRPPDDPKESMGADYFYSIDHPTLKRHIYRWVLHARGIEAIDIPNFDYEHTLEWNMEQGALPPLEEMVIPLRWANAAFVTAAVIIVYFAAFLLTRAPYWSLFAALPLVFDYRISMGVVAYLGTDAILAFFLALSLIVLIIFDAKGIASRPLSVIILGIVGGLVTSTKFNGALVPIAYAVYLAITNRGADRILKPAIASLVSLALFVVLNPVFHRGGIDWVASVIGDMLARRTELWSGQRVAWFLPRSVVVARFFPYAAFLFAAAAGLILWRRMKGVRAAAVWGIVVAPGTVASVNCTFQRYHLPVVMSACLLSTVAAAALLRRSRGDTDAAEGRSRLRAVLAPAVVGIAAILVVVNALVALEVWGPARIRVKTDRARRVALFWRQAAARAGLADAVGREEARDYVTVRREENQAPPLPLPEPVVGETARRVLNVFLFALAVYVIFRFARRIAGNAWVAVCVAAVFIWNEFTLGGGLSHTTSDVLLLVFAALAFDVASRLANAEGRAQTRLKALLILLAAAATAASPAGVFVAAAVAVILLLQHGARRLAWAIGSICAAVAAFPLLELAFWLVGARGAQDFLYGVLYGTAAPGPMNPLMRVHLFGFVRNGFEYVALLPIAAAALYALRERGWAPPTAILAGFILIGRAITWPEALLTERILGDFSPQMLADVNLALGLAIALPGLMLLSRMVSVQVELRDASDGPPDLTPSK